MGIKRYNAEKDTTITNAYKMSLVSRGDEANLGASDILEVFSIYGQASTSSTELSRVLLQFPMGGISADRTAGEIPASGSVSFYLRMFNTKHGQTLPREYTLIASAVSQSWEEGGGLDMEGYTDKGQSVNVGATWLSASSGNRWQIAGSDSYAESATTTFTFGATEFDDVPDATIELVDSVGNAKTYKIKASGADAASQEWDRGGSNTDAAAGFKIIVESTNGHNGIITVTDDGSGKVTLAQLVAGPAGNRAVNVSSSPDWNANTSVNVTDFTGGVSSRSYQQFLQDGTEDLELDITQVTEEWLLSEGATFAKTNYGLLIQLTGSQEAYYSGSSGADTGSITHNVGGVKTSYYTKKFHGRTSEYFFKRPLIEARWSNEITDDRSNFYFSSSLAPLTSNLNTLYLYNYVRGDLQDAGGNSATELTVRFFRGSTGPATGVVFSTVSSSVADGLPTHLTATRYLKGIYTASFALAPDQMTSDEPYLYDVWSLKNTIILVHTGSAITPKILDLSDIRPTSDYICKITNLKDSYRKFENPRLRLFVREKNWKPNIYTKAVSIVKSSIVENISYKVYRTVDDHEAIRHSTGSLDKETYLSYDASGSFFDLDMSMLQPDNSYTLQFAMYTSGKWTVQKDEFKFRVEDE